MRAHTFSCKAVIFDMDGVITNTMPYHFQAWHQALAEAGIAATCYDIYCREGQDGAASLKDIAREYGRHFTPAQIKRILARKERLFKSIVRVRFVPGSRVLLRRLHRQGFSLALVTGTSRREVEKILTPALRRLFASIVTGDEVAHGKPHPEPFLRALSQLGMPARDAVVVENAPFGIRAAKAARLRCIVLETSLPRRYLRGADAIVSGPQRVGTLINLREGV